MNRPGGLRNRGTFAMLTLAGLAVSSCAGGGTDAEVLVFAASSLTDTFAEMERAFEAEHPDTNIVLNVAGSSTLREQIIQGAPADVFASASLEAMSMVVDSVGARNPPQTFATNSLVIVVPPGNPGGVEGVESFTQADLVLGICAPGVPCGDAALDVFSRADVSPTVDTEEPNVRALLSKVVADELDAGLVYRTDAIAAGSRIEAVDVPSDIVAETVYPIAALGPTSTTSTIADDFVQFVVGPRGQAILDAYGFGAP